MNIEPQEITVRDLTAGYEDNEEGGVVGYSRELDIRPAYQREFIYKDKQRDAVIDTITKDFPLNVMYWAVREDGGFEIIDGQQRTISVCQYVEGDFAFEGRYFHNLQTDEQGQILDYPLMVYLCSGTDSEKLEWFKTINIAGLKLTDQELRNAVYSGSWVSDAKRYFSRSGCPAQGLGGDYMKGSSLRQEYLETVIKWISDDEIEQYMASNQHKPEAKELWLYFQSVIAWIKATFPTYRGVMKGIGWGPLYKEFKDAELDAGKIDQQVADLIADEDVSNKKGIYPFVLDGQEKHLNIRAFTPNMKLEAYERQKGICPVCGEHFEIDGMEADHITPWSKDGKTEAANCQMLCQEDNRRKSAI
jgi:HNH endonuclease/Protein of unknown function DUF262